MSDLSDQALTCGAMLASMPREASVGVSVLPNSVMSGAFLPLARAFCQSVVRSAHGIQTTLTLVFAYLGYCAWNCFTTPFIQVTSVVADGPIRQTVSVLGTPDDEDGELLPDPHPATAPASATIAPTARAGVLNRTAGSPFPGSSPRSGAFRGYGPDVLPVERACSSGPTRVAGRTFSLPGAVPVALGSGRRPASGPRR